MATTVVESYRLTVTTTPETVTVPKEASVVVVHRGINAAGAASTGNLYATTDGSTPLTDDANGEGLHTILSGESYPLVGCKSSFQIRADTADTLVQIIVTVPARDYIWLDENVSIVVANGGDAKTGTFYVFTDE